jgi:hypothetical protein
MKKKILNIILVLLVLSPELLSQETTKISPYIQISYLKNTDDLRILQTSLTYSKNRMELPLPGMEISFFNGSDKKELLIKAVTDSKGIARFEFPADRKLIAESDGTWAFSSEYAGNDTIEAGSSEMTMYGSK